MTFNNKKGSIQDIIFIAVALLFFGIVLLVGFKVASEVNTEFQANTDLPTEAKTASTTLTGYYPGIMDNTFLFLTIGLALATFILAAMVRVHPIFIAVYLIAMVILIFVSAVLSNIYQEMAASPTLIAQANQLTMTSTILNYLPFVVGIFSAILAIVMYKTWQAQNY